MYVVKHVQNHREKRMKDVKDFYTNISVTIIYLHRIVGQNSPKANQEIPNSQETFKGTFCFIEWDFFGTSTRNRFSLLHP